MNAGLSDRSLKFTRWAFLCPTTCERMHLSIAEASLPHAVGGGFAHRVRDILGSWLFPQIIGHSLRSRAGEIP